MVNLTKGGKLLANLLLLFTSIFLFIVIVEIILRILCPQYQYAARERFIPDQTRIFRNPHNSRIYLVHPDTKKQHLVIYNSLGCRQDREFSVEKPKGVKRILILGDSYSANELMEAQYSFSEPLDYLLNKTGGRYEVINSGTPGYGTDQEYLQYLQEGVRLDPDVVIYLYCGNDLSDININKLLKLDSRGGGYCPGAVIPKGFLN